jgi:hypothetical protein
MVCGGLVALAAGFHEQALTSLPVFALGIAWLSLKTEVETWRRTTLTIVAFVAPSLLLVSCFHIMNPIYGTGCASAGLLGELGETREHGSSQVTRYRLMNPGVVQENQNGPKDACKHTEDQNARKEDSSLRSHARNSHSTSGVPPQNSSWHLFSAVYWIRNQVRMSIESGRGSSWMTLSSCCG